MRYRMLAILIIVFGMLLAFTYSLSYLLGMEFEPQSNGLDLSMLEYGDIILTSGSRFDPLIPGKWSHAYMYIGHETVLDSDPMGVDVGNYTEILEANEALLLRVNATMRQRQDAVSFAMKQIGKPYSIAFWKKEVYSDSYYCSEIIWAAYMDAGIDLDGTPDLDWKAYSVTPSDLEEDSDTWIVAYAD